MHEIDGGICMSVHMCPWCDTEIVWDPEIGPEDFCPHCFNELGKSYRSINVDLHGEELEEDSDDYVDYEETMDNLRALQANSPECTTCGELMLEAGEQVIQPNGFRSLATIGGEPLLKAPFTVLTYVCPACFEVKQALSEVDREKWKLRVNTKE
jgi:hypothetical protein